MKKHSFFAPLVISALLIPVLANANTIAVTGEGTVAVTPNSGKTPLSVIATVTTWSTQGYCGGTDGLDFGDGSALVSVPTQGAASCATPLSQQFAHVYGSPGNYTVSLMTGGSQPASQAQVQVTASSTQAAAATIDQSSLASTSSQPTLTGSVSGVSGLWVLIGTVGGGENDSALLGTSLGTVTITGSAWSAAIHTTALTPGTYIVHVYDQNQYGGKQNLLATGNLVVSQGAACGSCQGLPFISAIAPTSGPVGTVITLSGSNFVQGAMHFYLSPIFANVPYSVSASGTKMTFVVPATALQTACGDCSQQPGPTPVLPGEYSLSLGNGGSGVSNAVKFTVTGSSTTSAPQCSSTWICTAWSACSPNGVQTRTCSDANSCSLSTNKPAELQLCVAPANQSSPDLIAALQSQISSLLAQMQQLQSQLHGSSPAQASAPCPVLARSLARGAQGNDVLQLQFFLAGTFNLDKSTIATGYFGPLTESYVMNFQSANGVFPASGIVGPLTRNAIQRSCTVSN